MVISKKFVATLLSVAIFLSLVSFSVFALEKPEVNDLGDGFTRITFPNGVIRDILTEQLKPNGIVVNDNGTVSVSFKQPSTQWNGLTYVVFNTQGQYDPVFSNLNNAKYTARNDRLLWRQSGLMRSKLAQMTLDVIKTSYPPPTSTEPVGTLKVYNFFLSGAEIYQGSYLGENYTLWQFKDIANVIKIGGDDGGQVPEDTTSFTFDFKLRFEDMNVNVLQGYNVCREIALKTNFSVQAKDYSNNMFYFPMYDYEINVQSSDGKTYNLYNSDALSSSNVNEDIDILYDADFNWSAGSFFTVRFYITPYGNNPSIPDFQPDSLVLSMFLYDKGHITLENPTLTNNVNTSIVNERLERKISLENDLLERFKNQLIDDGVISLETGLQNGINGIDSAPITEIFTPRGKVLTLVSTLMIVSCSIALIGFALVGKKG